MGIKDFGLCVCVCMCVAYVCTLVEERKQNSSLVWKKWYLFGGATLCSRVSNSTFTIWISHVYMLYVRISFVCRIFSRVVYMRSDVVQALDYAWTKPRSTTYNYNASRPISHSFITNKILSAIPNIIIFHTMRIENCVEKASPTFPTNTEHKGTMPILVH